MTPDGYEGLVAERRVTFARAASNARTRWTERSTLLVAFRGPEGAVGRSEASPLPGFGDDSVERALAVWNGYHTRVAAKELESTVTAEDPTLLLYYQNRLVPFATRVVTNAQDEAAAAEIAHIGGRR